MYKKPKITKLNFKLEWESQDKKDAFMKKKAEVEKAMNELNRRKNMQTKIGCDNCQEESTVTTGSNAHKTNLCHGCYHDMKESTIEKALRHRFEAHGIPYDNIDPEMIEMLDVLNFELGLRTKFCCFGHKDGKSFSVMFHESVTDEQIMKLAEHTGLDSESTYVTFSKWLRWSPIQANWIMESGMRWKADDPYKKVHLDQITKLLRKYEV